MPQPLDDTALDMIFRKARSYNAWSGQPLSREHLRSIYDLMKWGATSANCSPARFVFVISRQGKQRLKPHLMEGNVDKTMAAPVCVIIGYDLKFYDAIPELFPHNPGAREWFSEDRALAEETALRNGTLQGAYLMLAARALGFDCGPMSGFNAETLDKEFFAGTSVKSNFLCNLGLGTEDNLFPRSPRLSFDKACQIV